MEFNNVWNKEANDWYRNMIKQNIPMDEILEKLGIKIFYHPDKKFVSNFTWFKLNEIKYNAKKTNFQIVPKQSLFDKNEIDYEVVFDTTSNNKYYIDLLYYIDNKSPYPNQPLYNFSFTISENHDLSNPDIYEKPTQKKETLEIMSRMLYILPKITEIIEKTGIEPIYVIGLSEDYKRNIFYGDVIKSIGYSETLGESSENYGRKTNYYKKIK